jgi:kynurenine formamidase
MHQRAFDFSYTAFTADGAQWLVDNTDIALIGIDYLSIAIHDDLTGPHDIVLGAVSQRRSAVLENVSVMARWCPRHGARSGSNRCRQASVHAVRTAL